VTWQIVSVRAVYSQVKLFGNIFAPSNSLEICTVSINMLEKNQSGTRGSCKLNGRGYKKLAFFD